MMRHLLQIILFALFVCPVVFLADAVHAAPFEVKNIAVSIQSESAVKARDLAMTKAQRVAFAALVGKTENDLPNITDTQISRLARGFSLQGERLAARSYSANFTIRFSPALTNNFILMNNLQLTPQAASGQTISVNRVVTNTPVAPAATVDADGKPVAAATSETATTETTAPAESTIIALPVLDIGSRRVIWDEPGSWRDVWQQRDQSVPGLKIRVPLGDVDDIADVPDASFLNSGSANITKMLGRYNASGMYVIVAKNQGAALNTGGGMALSLYFHDGQKLKFLKKQVIRPRQGYLFNDAVPAAMQMIVSAQNGTAAPSTTTLADAAATSGGTTVDKTVLDPTTTPSSQQMAAPVSGPIILTVPYQSLQQWIGIQRRLRMVPGVKSVVPLRVSPSSAQISVLTTLSSTADVERNMAMQNFAIQKLPSGDMALLDK